MTSAQTRATSWSPSSPTATGCWSTLSAAPPGTGETAVLWGGTGLVVKRVEVLPNAEPPRLRLISAK